MLLVWRHMHSQCQLGRRQRIRRCLRGETAARSGRLDSYCESMASRCWDNACRKRAERYASYEPTTLDQRIERPRSFYGLAHILGHSRETPPSSIDRSANVSRGRGTAPLQKIPPGIPSVFFAFFALFCGYSCLYIWRLQNEIPRIRSCPCHRSRLLLVLSGSGISTYASGS